ncbi:MAG: TIGR02147 family protein [Bdellovibrionota bacterium]
MKKESVEKTTTPRARPVVYDYGSPHDFFHDLLAHYKTVSRFSVRQRSCTLKKCSPALVSQVIAGKRRLTRDQLPSFAKLFKLNNFEFDFIDKNLRSDLWVKKESSHSSENKPKMREPKNHILNSWLNVYVKDLVNLIGFSTETKVLHKMLLGLASPRKIEQSVSFLLKEGFWRKTASGKIIPEDPALISTNEIHNDKIRLFHKQALKIALRGLDALPVNRRKASTVLMSINKEKLPELRSLIDAFQAQLLKFIDDHPTGSDELVQVTINLTPVGGKNA